MSNPSPSLIVGAGLAGLLAAHAWPSARIVDRAPGPAPAHRALLRFRGDAVARLTGIEFRRVLVRKGIWLGNKFHAPDIRLANMYSRKVLGRIVGERSIWNVEPVERFVAPEDFYDQLIANVNSRVAWGEEVVHFAAPGPVISTAPLSETILLLRDPPALDFHRAPIVVRRFRLPDSTDIHHTVYFPDNAYSLYRASITGRTLICEFANDTLPDEYDEDAPDLALRAFGLFADEVEPDGGPARQHFGKIAPIDDAARKHAIFRLSHERNIFSLGRFATWRNILLDDVVQDIDIIKRLLRSGAYERVKS